MVGRWSLVFPCDGADLPAGSSESYPPEGAAMLQECQAFRVGVTLGSLKDESHCNEGHQAEKAAREKVHDGALSRFPLTGRR